MHAFKRKIRPHVEAELERSERALRGRDAAMAFSALERAHVLGQSVTSLHVRVHWRMFTFGWRQRNPRECAGQVLRLVGAATKTAFGLVPAGNTGGSNVSPFRALPVEPELAARIAVASRSEPDA